MAGPGSGWGSNPQPYGGLGARGKGPSLGPGPAWQAGKNAFGGLGALAGKGGLTGGQVAQYGPTKPAAPVAAKPPAGGAGGAGGAGQAAAAPSPYDSTYYIDLADATAKANGKIGIYNADITNGATNLQNTLQQLAYNQTISDRNAQNTENARGGFAQGALGNTLGQIAHTAQTTGSTDTLRYSQDAAAWRTAIDGVNSGLSIQTIALGLASAARQPAPPDPGVSKAAAAPAPAPTGLAGATSAGAAKGPLQSRGTPPRSWGKAGKAPATIFGYRGGKL